MVEHGWTTKRVAFCGGGSIYGFDILSIGIQTQSKWHQSHAKRLVLELNLHYKLPRNSDLPCKYLHCAFSVERKEHVPHSIPPNQWISPWHPCNASNMTCRKTSEVVTGNELAFQKYWHMMSQACRNWRFKQSLTNLSTPWGFPNRGKSGQPKWLNPEIT